MADHIPITDSARPDSRESLRACMKAARDDAMSLNGIIRAMVIANLSYDSDTEPDVADLVRNAIDGLLEAAQKLSAKLPVQLDGVDLGGGAQ